jgi:hypothetical protein
MTERARSNCWLTGIETRSACRSPQRPRRLAQAQNDLIWTAADVAELDLAAAPNGGYVRASDLGRQSHQVIALAATGQLGMAAAGQIRLAVVTHRH